MAVLHIDGRGPVLILVLVDVGLGRTPTFFGGEHGEVS